MVNRRGIDPRYPCGINSPQAKERDQSHWTIYLGLIPHTLRYVKWIDFD